MGKKDDIKIEKNTSLILTTGRAYPGLAEDIAEELDVSLLGTQLSDFANGEIYVRFDRSVRNTDVFLVQTHTWPMNKWIMEQLIMIDALKRASAHSITVITPFLGYARQDKKHLSRESISARLICDLIYSAGASRLMTVDLHSPQIQGFLNIPVDHLEAQGLLAKYVRQNYDLSNTAIISPDEGRIKVATQWANKFGGLSLGFVHKYRNPKIHNEAVSGAVIGDVNKKDCILVDDMIDTAGTLCGAAEVLMNAGAKSVIAVATHGVFSPPAIERLKNAPFKEVIITNTLPISPEKHFDKLTVLSCAPLIARAVNAVFRTESLGDVLSKGNLPIKKV